MPDDVDIKSSGYLLPEPITGWDLICVTLRIPDAPEYRAAFRGSLKSLTEWWNWQRTGDTKGSEAATYWRQLIHEHLRFMDCYDLGEELGNVSRPRLCKVINENGTIDYKISYNDGCTWELVELCEDSPGEEVIPIVGSTAPEDNPGGVTDPPFGIESRCKIATFAFKNIIGLDNAFSDFGGFCLYVLDGDANGLAGRLLTWLNGRGTNMGLPFIEYYPTFKALVEEFYPYASIFVPEIDGAIFGDNFCMIYDCIPDTGNITRSVLNCVADGYSSQVNPPSVDEHGIYALAGAFLRVYPLAWARYRALEATGSEEEYDCSSCDETVPDPIICDVRQNFDFKVSENSLGFINLDAPPLDFSCGQAVFKATNYFAPASHIESIGVQVGVMDGVNKALGIWRVLETPYKLCQLHVPIVTSTGKLNTRFAAAWYRDAAGIWTCLTSQKIAIYKTGNIALLWSGSVTATAIAVVGIAGGGYMTIQKIDMNYGVLEA